MNDIPWSMEHKNVTTLVCLDLSAAFDTVDHEILLQTLKNTFGVLGLPLKWFESYLSDRYMKVCIGECYSCNKLLPFSVPQGSCGGPVLLNCYTGSIKSVIDENISMYGFADDHTLQHSFEPSLDGNNELQCIRHLEQNLRKNRYLDG